MQYQGCSYRSAVVDSVDRPGAATVSTGHMVRSEVNSLGSAHTQVQLGTHRCDTLDSLQACSSLQSSSRWVPSKLAGHYIQQLAYKEVLEAGNAGPAEQSAAAEQLGVMADPQGRLNYPPSAPEE